MNQQITLDAWIEAQFAAGCRPHINTVRKWAKSHRIQPEPVKCGRSYYVDPAARYTELEKAKTPTPDSEKKPRLIDRVRATETAQT